MPRTSTQTPSKRGKRNKANSNSKHVDHRIESMPIKSSLYTLTQSHDKNKNSNLTSELEGLINEIKEMNVEQIKAEIVKSFNTNNTLKLSNLIRGLFRGYQNYSHHYLALLNNRNDKQEQVIDDDDDDEDEDCDEIINRNNSKRGEVSFMEKSLQFFREFSRIISHPHHTNEHQKWTEKAISIYSDEISVMPLAFLAYNAYHIVSSVSDDDNTGKAFDLLPRLLMSLKHAHKIELYLIQRDNMNGREFETFIIDCICGNRWNIDNNCMVINIISCLKDLNLSKNVLIGCLAKIMQIIHKLSHSSLPPLILQLLLLGQKGNMMLILKYILTFFNDLDGRVEAQEEKIALWREQSQILYHFHYISQQDHNVFSDLLKLIKNRLVKLDTFTFACLLSIASIRRFSNKIFKFIMTYIREYFEYNQYSKTSFFFYRQFVTSSHHIYYSPIWTLFEQIMYRSIRGKWDQINHSLIQLGFRLLDFGDIAPQKMHFVLFMNDANRSNNNNNAQDMIMTQKIYKHLTQRLTQHINTKSEIGRQSIDDQLTQRECVGFLGCHILKMIFFCQTNAVYHEIIDKLLERIITSSNNNSTNVNGSLRLFQILTNKKPSIFISKKQIMSKLDLHLEEITNLSPLIAIGFIHALNPIIELRPDFSDKILYYLRKALYSPKLNVRILGVEGFISILQFTKTGGMYRSNNNNNSRSKTLSQKFGALQCSQQFITNPRQYLSMEIIGYLRRALNQQTVIRERVYFGAERLISMEPSNKILLLNLLLNQLKIYYVNAHDAQIRNIYSPLDFDKCFDKKHAEKLIEPLPALLMVSGNMLHQYETEGYNFDELYEKKKQFKEEDDDADEDEEDDEFSACAAQDKFLMSLPSNIALLFEIKVMMDEIVKRLSTLRLEHIEFEKPNKFKNKPELHGLYQGHIRYLLFGCIKTCCSYALRCYLLSKKQEILLYGTRLINKYHEIEQRDLKKKKELKKKRKKGNDEEKDANNSQESRNGILPSPSQSSQASQRVKIKLDKQLTSLYFVMDGYLAGSKILQSDETRMFLLENDRMHKLKLFMLENTLEHLKAANKYINESKSIKLKNKKEFSPIIPTIVPYLGAVGCYQDVYGGISDLIYAITCIFPSLYKQAINETSELSAKRKELADPHHCSDSDDEDEEDEEEEEEAKKKNKKRKKPLIRLKKKTRVCELAVECLAYMLDIASSHDNTTAFKLLVNWGKNDNVFSNNHNVLDDEDWRTTQMQDKIQKRHKWAIKAIVQAFRAGMKNLPHLWSNVVHKITVILSKQYTPNRSALSSCISLYEENSPKQRIKDYCSNIPPQIKEYCSIVDDEDDSESDDSDDDESQERRKKSKTGVQNIRVLIERTYDDQSIDSLIHEKNVMQHLILSQVAMLRLSSPKNLKSYCFDLSQDILFHFGYHELQKRWEKKPMDGISDLGLDDKNITSILELHFKLIHTEMASIEIAIKLLDLLPAVHKFKTLFIFNNDDLMTNGVDLTIPSSLCYNPIECIDFADKLNCIVVRIFDFMRITQPLAQCDLPNKFKQNVLKIFTSLYKMLYRVDCILLKHNLYPSTKYEGLIKKIATTIYDTLQRFIDQLHHDDKTSDQINHNGEKQINSKIRTMQRQGKEMVELLYFITEHNNILGKIAMNKKMPSLKNASKVSFKARSFKLNREQVDENDKQKRENEAQVENSDNDDGDQEEEDEENDLSDRHEEDNAEEEEKEIVLNDDEETVGKEDEDHDVLMGNDEEEEEEDELDGDNAMDIEQEESTKKKRSTKKRKRKEMNEEDEVSHVASSDMHQTVKDIDNLSIQNEPPKKKRKLNKNKAKLKKNKSRDIVKKKAKKVRNSDKEEDDDEEDSLSVSEISEEESSDSNDLSEEEESEKENKKQKKKKSTKRRHRVTPGSFAPRKTAQLQRDKTQRSQRKRTKLNSKRKRKKSLE
eukprot:227832_1